MNLLCRIGIHKYKQRRPPVIHNGFPFFGERYDNPTRTCKRCGKRQWWLPSYGGSEWGCWATESRRPNINVCPGCGGKADRGFDRCVPPNPYYCSKCNWS